MTTQTSAHAAVVVGQGWPMALSTLVLIFALVVAALGIRGSLPAAAVRAKRPLSAAALLISSLVVVLSGGTITSIALVGIAAWGMAECFSVAIGIAAFLLAALASALALAKSGPFIAIGGAAAAAAIGALPYFYARTLSALHARRERRVTRLEAQISRPTPARPMPTEALKREVLLSVERTEATKDLAILDGLLRDIRDLIQADEAIFWRWSEDRDTLIPQAWSSEDAARPQFFRVKEWGPLARWSAQERIVSFDGSDDAPFLVAAPVTSKGDGNGEALHGVITVSCNGGLSQSRESMKDWLPRFAGQLASYLELIDMRTAYSRSSRRNQALIDAMQRLQVHKSAEALGSAVCEAALEVTSGRSALLIRWLPQDAYGLVQYASRELALELGMIIGKDTLVGRTCRDGMPLLLHDARAVTRSEPAYTSTLAYRPIPSLVVVPIVVEQRVIGAIVVEGTEPTSLGVEEARNVGLLAAVARAFLEKVWEIEDVTERARTDALTGLGNRRYLDEQLRRVLAETDRFGGSSSLIFVDIDDFKKINDTYGHEAGDAVLRHIGKILGDGVRAVDICARYGGEELVTLLPQTPISGATELAERLRSAIAERPVVFEGASIPVTASFGIAGYPETVPHGDWLLPAADRALYLAKESGKNCVRALLTSDGIPKKYQSGLQ
ncbi:MAG TPA: sensor domain-containing diguanylate cyclase [Gemmatimonadaceae bacterium]